MAQITDSTVEKILHSATLLFSERGFAETSLRTITGMAEVNLAAVNYHFGSKKTLIQAVFSRFLTPFGEELDKRIDELEKSENVNPSAEYLLRTMFESFFLATESIHEDPQRFMRLLGLAYSQSQEHLRHFMVSEFGDTYHRFTQMLSTALNNQNPVEFYWRLYFMMGAGVFTLSSYDAIRSILNADYKQDSSMQEVVDIMVPSMVGILRPPNAENT